MQFREQGKKIQCIRSTYDPASKRSHQKVVAAFDRWADKLPSVEVADLTDAEFGEANLRSASIDGCTVTGTRWQGAEMTAVRR